MAPTDFASFCSTSVWHLHPTSGDRPSFTRHISTAKPGTHTASLVRRTRWPAGTTLITVCPCLPAQWWPQLSTGGSLRSRRASAQASAQARMQASAQARTQANAQPSTQASAQASEQASKPASNSKQAHKRERKQERKQACKRASAQEKSDTAFSPQSQPSLGRRQAKLTLLPPPGSVPLLTSNRTPRHCRGGSTTTPPPPPPSSTTTTTTTSVPRSAVQHHTAEHGGN